ncbi:MAG: NAD(P)-dependent oxidoreductase [Candidatus Nanohaloarchaea archaeon]
MDILLTGSKGKLGREIQSLLDVKGLSLEEDAEISADISQTSTITKIVEENPSVIIHTAAIHANECEEDKEKCQKVNVEGTKNIVEAAEKVDAHLIFISSSHVFSGTTFEEYTEESKTDPVLEYGKSKKKGEDIVSSLSRHTILRSSLMYGSTQTQEATSGNFFSWAKSGLEAGKEIDIIMDQVNSPVYVGDVAKVVEEAVKKERYGLYNVASQDSLSRYMAVKELKNIFELGGKINPILREDLGWQNRGFDYTMSINKLKNNFDYTPSKFTEGVKRWKEAQS